MQSSHVTGAQHVTLHAAPAAWADGTKKRARAQETYGTIHTRKLRHQAKVNDTFTPGHAVAAAAAAAAAAVAAAIVN